MTIQTHLRAQRLSHMCAKVVLGFILFLGLSGCSLMQLNKFNKHAADGDYQWIAAQAVTCHTSTGVCSRLHLIKGEACLHLARTGAAPVDNYTCAADETEQGLALKKSWQDADVHRHFQENLCESLRNLQDQGVDEANAQGLTRYLGAAQGLYRLAPESVPAVYYLASARLHQVRPMLRDINPASRLLVCNRLKRTVTRVLSMMETTNAVPLPDWQRFVEKFQRLAFELGEAMRAAECR